jgi:protein-L-isoaspartate O-methyltransferase
MTYIDCAYDPADDKLRLRASSRLDKETYERVKAAGYSWAPKQECFYAVWAPHREDLALELAGEIGDEDTTLVDRAEQRAERFEGYSDNRERDAQAAKAAVDRIADGIPMGQPILVGHHSERHARKDAERIENGMRKAVKMWETSKYWTDRAESALRHAKYLERADVRARRIKTLEADKRKQEKYKEHAEAATKLWLADGLTLDRAKVITNYSHIHHEFKLAEYPRNPPASQYEGSMSLWSALEDGIITAEQARDIAIPVYSSGIAHADRWIAHLSNRIEYERAMLGEQGGLKGEQFDYQPGGQIKRRGEWLIVKKVNKIGGKVNSVSVLGHWASTVTVDEIQDYKPPAEGHAEKVKAATKLPPLCNFRTEGCAEMTSEQWKRCQRFSDTYYVETHKATETTGAYRHRSKFGGVTTNYARIPVFLTDAKVVPAPAPVKAEPVHIERPISDPRPAPAPRPEPSATDAEFQAMRDTLKAGVQVVSAPQLFPTPPELARRVVDEAGVQPGHRVLEPSAGTGNLVTAIINRGFLGLDRGGSVVAVEINSTLAAGLEQQRNRTLYANDSNFSVRNADFLECNGDLGTFDRIVMNPPFVNGSDIRHIEHAVKFLRPGGRLVAICAAGPRQREKLAPLAEASGGYWEDLPAGSFESQGTGVNTALVVIRG